MHAVEKIAGTSTDMIDKHYGLAAFEASVAAIVIKDLLNREEVSEADYERLIAAGMRLRGVARGVIGISASE